KESDRLPGSEAVVMRLLELATSERAAEVAKDILADYSSYKTEDWIRLPEPGRRFLWQKLVEYQIYPTPPLAPDSEHGKIVEEIIFATNTPDAGYWFALYDWTQAKEPPREKMVDHLLAID